MINFSQLHQKIHRKYTAVLQASLQDADIFPMILPADKTLPANFSEWTKALEEIIANSADRKPNGYSIEYEQRNLRQHGIQTLPLRFCFDSRDQYLAYINKTEEFDDFVTDSRLLLSQHASLMDWAQKHTQEIIAYHGQWPSLLKVTTYFSAHPLPHRFARELPLGLSTKFIENHKGILYQLLNEVLPETAIRNEFETLANFEHRFGLLKDSPRIRLRVLDEQLARAYAGGFNDLSIPVADFSNLRWPVERVIVLENKVNFSNADSFLTLPQTPNSLAVFGSGFSVALLAGAAWLKQIPILYWGDIDAEGFEILNNFRTYFPHVHSFCMNEETLQNFATEAVAGNGAPFKNLPLLTPAEQRLYARICQTNLRLEQEYIDQAWVLQSFHSVVPLKDR